MMKMQPEEKMKYIKDNYDKMPDSSPLKAKMKEYMMKDKMKMMKNSTMMKSGNMSSEAEMKMFMAKLNDKEKMMVQKMMKMQPEEKMKYIKENYDKMPDGSPLKAKMKEYMMKDKMKSSNMTMQKKWEGKSKDMK